MTFPATMVDRIVPATTAETLARAEPALGVADLAAVARASRSRSGSSRTTSPAAGRRGRRPARCITDDAGPWERLKLRALNGVHSALAYLGALAGAETIAEALAMPGHARGAAPARRRGRRAEPHPAGRRLGRRLRRTRCCTRFANPAIGHRTLQVAMDGTQKLPQRLLSVLNTVPAPQFATLIAAAWAEYAAGDDSRCWTTRSPPACAPT